VEGVIALSVHRAHVMPPQDWRRIATRYDKLAANFTAAVMLGDRY
jgi:hypothetical protein